MIEDDERKVRGIKPLSGIRKNHTVQKLIVIFDKLHRTFDFFISLYDMYACKKTLKKLI